MSDIINGWKVECVNMHDGRKGVNPCFVNTALKLRIEVPHELLSVFGFQVAGCELGIIGQSEKGDIQQQIEALILTLSTTLVHEIKEPKWYTIKQYLKNYKGRMRLGKYIQPPNSTLKAIDKTISIVEYDYQEIYKLSISLNEM